MEARAYLDEIKRKLSVKTDEELALKIGASPSAIGKWIQRNSVPVKWKLIIEKILDQKTNVSKCDKNETIAIPKLSITASAGYGTELEGIENFTTGEVIHIDKALFKTPPPKDLNIIKVEGYSMVPVLLPDTWVVFERVDGYTTDGIYIINWRNNLMAKLVQLTPGGRLKIISANKDYESWEIDPDDQSAFHIIGKVIRVIM